MMGNKNMEEVADSFTPNQKHLLSSGLVIAGPSSKDLASNISDTLDMDMIYPELRVFSDGESKIRINEELRNRTCVIVQSALPPRVDSCIMQTLMMLKKCADDSAKNIVIVAPYLAYARQDRVFLEGEVLTVELIAQLYEMCGARNMITVDIHSLRALSYFKRKMHAINVSAVPLLADYAKSNLGMNKHNSVTISPDEGGFERAQSFALLLDNNVVCLKKIRDRKTGEVSTGYLSPLEEKKIRGLDVVLIDDIVSTGNTIIKTVGVLKASGCGTITVMCSHALLTEESSEHLKSAGVDKMVTTNSVPKAAGGGTFVEAIDLSPVLAPAISKIIAL